MGILTNPRDVVYCPEDGEIILIVEHIGELEIIKPIVSTYFKKGEELEKNEWPEPWELMKNTKLLKLLYGDKN